MVAVLVGGGSGVGDRELPDAAFLKLALMPHRRRMLAALQRGAWAKSEHFELEVVGIPGVTLVALFAWPEPLGKPRRIAVDVVRYDGTVLSAPVRFAYELQEHERPHIVEEPVAVAAVEPPPIITRGRPAVVVVNGPEGPVTWSLVGPGEDGERVEREVQKLDAKGQPVLAAVDVTTSCYRMLCVCGRVRYARPNGLHQITLCRVCTRAERLRKRALSQYKKRRASPKKHG